MLLILLVDAKLEGIGIRLVGSGRVRSRLRILGVVAVLDLRLVGVCSVAIDNSVVVQLGPVSHLDRIAGVQSVFVVGQIRAEIDSELGASALLNG